MLLNCIARSATSSAFTAVFARRTTLPYYCSSSSTASFSSSAAADAVDVHITRSASASNARSDDAAKQQELPKARRRTRRRTGGGGGGANPIPSLADFMHRAKVLRQYRNFVRLARFADGKDNNNGTTPAGECRAALEEVRLTYKMGTKKATDALSKNMAFAEGERRLRELRAMVGYSPTKNNERQQQQQQSNDGGSTNDAAAAASAMSAESYDDDSWINIKDDEDPRGRVGVQWPWEKDE